MRRHSAYKTTDAKWLGEIPTHWDLVPSQWLFHENIERARDEDVHLSATQKYGVIPLEEFERLEGRRVTHAFKNLEQRKHAELNDFVISMRSFEGGIERVMAQGCVRSSYIVLHATAAAHVGFFSYLFKSTAYIQGLQATATFIRDGQDLNFSNFRQIKLPRLDVQEQGKIAQLLDGETTRIDGLIERKTHFIELLREKRQALITHAVTNGLDPGAPMKDSGVEWLGQVPAHWSTSRLRFVALIRNSNVDKKSYDGQKTVSMCNYVDVYYNERITPEIAFRKATATPAEIDAFTLRGGDVVMTKDSESPDDIGVPALASDSLTGVVCGYHLTLLRANDRIVPEYLFRVLQSKSIAAYYEAKTPGVTRFGLSLDVIGSTPVPLPSREEQRVVCGFLNVQTTRIDTLIAKTERSIELLREKRSALITAAVTGKIDLRDAA
jgi:type I restriction enzyme S subunit